MNRDQILERANRWVGPRYGSRIGKRRLHDLVHEELVRGPARAPHPGQRAARWEWSAASYAQLLRVCRAQHRGVRTFDQLRISFWLRGSEPLTDKVRASMLREHRRLYKRVFRPLRNDAGPPSSGGDPRDRRIRALEGKKGDERLKPFDDLIPPNIRTRFYDATRFGFSFDAAPLIAALGRLLPPPLTSVSEAKDAILDLRGLAQLAEDDDDPVEPSGEHSLATLPTEKFEETRRLFRLLRESFLLSPRASAEYVPLLKPIADVFHLIGWNLIAYPWNFVLFVILLHGTRRFSKVGKFNDAIGTLIFRFLNGGLLHAS